jgi:hypothetical protein
MQLFHVGDFVTVNMMPDSYTDTRHDALFVNDRMVKLSQADRPPIMEVVEISMHGLDSYRYNIAFTQDFNLHRGWVYKKDDLFYWFLGDMLTKVGSLRSRSSYVERNEVKVLEDFELKSYELDKSPEIAQRIADGELVKLDKPSTFSGSYVPVEDTMEMTYMRNLEGYSDYPRSVECTTIIIHKSDEEDFVQVGEKTYSNKEFDIIWCDGRGSVREDEHIFDAEARYCESNNCWYHTDDVGDIIFYWDCDGEYHDEPEPEEELHEYHSGPRETWPDARNADWKVGFEVEKEDYDPIHSYSLSDCDRTMWARESDSSLGDGGFEFVSPVFNLFTDGLEESVKSPIVSYHINADCSRSCGGHINISRSGMTGEELFGVMKPYVPLFLALYSGRMDNTYSKAMKHERSYISGGKYQAIAVKQRIVELRIVSAVPNVDTLLWRRDLIRIVAEGCDNSVRPMQVLRDLLDKRSALHKHLAKVYDADKIALITSMYAQFADDFFNTYQVTKNGEGVFFKTFTTNAKRKKIERTVFISIAERGFNLIRNTIGTNDHAVSEQNMSNY